MREFALRRRASVPLLELRGAGTHIRGDGLTAGREQAHHLPADALDLEPVAVIARGPFQAEPSGQRLFQMLGDDRGDRADMLGVAQRVRGPPLAVAGCSGDVGDLGVDVQLHVAVPGGVLQPVGDSQVRLVPLAGLPAVHPGVVRAGAGVARPPAGSSRTRCARPARSCRRPRRPGRTSTHPLPGHRPGGPGGRSRPGRRGRSRWTSRATGSGRRTGGFAGFAWWLRSAARVCVRRWRAVRRPAGGRTGPPLCGRRPVACPAGYRRGLCACRTAGRTVGAPRSGRARSRGP